MKPARVRIPTKLRLWVYLRDGFTCADCRFRQTLREWLEGGESSGVGGLVNHLTLHHRDGDRSNIAPANLETVCRNCHDVREGIAYGRPLPAPDVRRWLRLVPASEEPNFVPGFVPTGRD